MRTLLLLRHAKSDWDDPELDDHERPLAPRGAKAAPMMGRLVVREGLKPDLVLCSDSVRTRATLALVLPELGPPTPAVSIESGLYLASPATLLERIRAVDAGIGRLMVIAHNPGLHALALELIRDGRRKDIAQLATKFPTAALAVLELDAETWSAVGPARGRLALFATPRGGD